MANERIEIDIVLNDGSVGKAFASIPRAAENAVKDTQKSIGGIEGALKGLGSSVASISTSFVALGAAIGVGIGIKKIADFIGDAVEEAKAGQESINNLANSLRAAGDLSESTVEKFKQFAKTTQATTVLTDDQVLSLSALARNYTKTSDEAIRLTKAAIQLSAATGTDVNSALDQLGGTFNGVSGRLGKLIPGFNGLSESALRSGEAIDLVLNRFGGSAESKVQTFQGSIAQLKNEFSDFLEGIGNLIIRSPALTAVFTEVSNIFRDFSKSVSSITESNNDVLGPIINQTIKFGLTFNEFAIKPLEVLIRYLGFVKNVWRQYFDFVALGFGKLAGFGASILEFIGGENTLTKNLKSFKESTKEVFDKDFASLGKSASNIFSTSFSDNIESTLSRIGQSVSSASKTLLPEVKIDKNIAAGIPKQIIPNINKDAIDAIKKLGEIKGEALILRSELEKLGDSDLFGLFKERLDALPDAIAIASANTQTEVKKQIESMKLVKDEIVGLSNQIGSAIENGITNSISQGVQSIVDALLTGKNAFGAFLGTVLGVFGDLAIQIGTTLIGIGIGIDSIKASLATLSGGIAIAAGIALVAAGSLLKGLAGGLGGKAPAPASSITAPGTPATPVSGGSISDDLRDRQTAQIVINGDLLDADSTGLRIANILKDQGFANAVIA